MGDIWVVFVYRNLWTVYISMLNPPKIIEIYRFPPLVDKIYRFANCYEQVNLLWTKKTPEQTPPPRKNPPEQKTPPPQEKTPLEEPPPPGHFLVQKDWKKIVSLFSAKRLKKK